MKKKQENTYDYACIVYVCEITAGPVCIPTMEKKRQVLRLIKKEKWKKRGKNNKETVL
jgi:hypothetical protein